MPRLLHYLALDARAREREDGRLVSVQENRVQRSCREALKNKEGVMMNRFQGARLASLICLAGGTLQIIYGLLAIPFPPYVPRNLSWDEALWALANVGMMGGAAGLLALDVARPRWLAVIGATLTILGNLIRIGVAAWNIVSPTSATVPFILLSIFLLIPGMGVLGITTLLGKRLTGWQAWTPLLAAGFSLIPVAIYSINQFVHFLLLGLWGLPWVLVGYVIFTHSAKREQAVLVQARGSNDATMDVPAHAPEWRGR